jgi:hypothetical protein
MDCTVNYRAPDGSPSLLYPELETAFGDEAGYSMFKKVKKALESGRFASRQPRSNGEPTLAQVQALLKNGELDPPSATMVNTDKLAEITTLAARSAEIITKRLERYKDPKSAGTDIKVSAEGKAELRRLKKRLEDQDKLTAYVSLVQFADRQLREFTHFVDAIFDAEAAAANWGRNQHPAGLDEIMVQLKLYEDVLAPDLANANSTLRDLLVGTPGTVGLQRQYQDLQAKVKTAKEKYLVELDNLHNNRQGLSKEQILADLKGGKDVSVLTKALSGATQSSNKQLSLVAAVVDHAKLRGRDLGQQWEAKVIEEQAKLAKAGVQDHAFMTILDTAGKTTMQVVEKIGESYRAQRKSLKDAVKDAGDYIKGTGLSAEDKTHNKARYTAAQALRKFNQAEIIDEAGQTSDGEHHRYTEEFKQQRAYFQELRQDGQHWSWQQRAGVDPVAYEKFEAKYYGEEVTFMAMNKATDAAGNRVSTGEMQERVGRFTNADATTEIVEERHRDPRYAALLADTSVSGKARLNFFNFYHANVDRFVRMQPKEDSEHIRKGQVPALMAKVIDKRYNSKGPGWLDYMGRVVTNPVGALKGLMPAAEAGRLGIRTREDGSLLKDVEKKYTGGFKDAVKIARLQVKLQALDKASTTYKDDEARLKQSLTIEQNRPEAGQGETNLSKVLLAYGAMALNYEQLKQQEGTLNLLRDALKNRTFYEEKNGELVLNEEGQPIPKKDYSPQVVKQTTDWLDQNYYHDTGLGQDAWEQGGRAFKQYVSFAFQGMNYAAALKNITAGNLTNRIYAAGKQFGWDKKIANRAFALFMKDGANIAADKWAERINGDGLVLHPKRSLVDALMEKYGLLEHSKDVNGKSSLLNDAAFAMTTVGEYQIQSQVALCKLMSTELVGKDGSKAVAMDVHSLSNGQLRVDPNFAEAWETVRHRVTLDIRNLNKHISGNHSSEDKVALEKEWMGASLLQFHRWAHNGFKNRFGRKQFDEGIGITTEGYYRGMYRFLQALATFGLKVDTYRNLSEADKASVRMTLTELKYAAALFALTGILAALKPEPDDEDKHWLYIATNLGQRVLSGAQSELTVFLNPLELYNMAKNPAAGLGMVKDLATFGYEAIKYPYYGLTGQEEELYYKTGSRKGQLKVWKAGKDVFPILRMDRIYEQLQTTGTVWIK